MIPNRLQAQGTISCDFKSRHFTLECIRMVCLANSSADASSSHFTEHQTVKSIWLLHECLFSLRVHSVLGVEGRGTQRCTSTVVCSNHAHRLPEGVLNKRKARVHIWSCVCTRELICMLRNIRMPVGQRRSTVGRTMSHICGRQWRLPPLQHPNVHGARGGLVTARIERL